MFSKSAITPPCRAARGNWRNALRCEVTMLIKVQFGGKKKYIKLEEVCFLDFLSAVQQKFLIPEDTTLKVTDDHGVEVDEDVFPELATNKEMCFIIHTDDELLFAETSKGSTDFSDLTEFGASSNHTEYVTVTTCDLTVLQQGVVQVPSSPSLTDTLSVSSSLSSSDSGSQIIQPVMDRVHARNNIKQILTSKPTGLTVIKEYEETGSLKDSTRRLMVNIIVAHMREKEGRAVSKGAKEFHAFGIVSLFPTMKDPYSKKGYEHFYDIQSNTGFLEWRMKTVQRKSRTSTSQSRVELKGGPTLSRTIGALHDQRMGDECMEAMSLLHHTTDHDTVFKKMKETFHYRQQILHDPQRSANVLQMFPRFLDVKGLEKWNTSLKEKVIQEARNLKETALLKRHLKAALKEDSDTTDDPEWDSDMASLFVLLHLLTPQPAGRKRPKKISVEEATTHLVKFYKSCQSLDDHLLTTEGNPQPYLLASGTSKAQVSTFYIVMDRKILPCQSCTSLGAFDELFKSHFVFGVKYDDALSSLYTFVQTTVYNIDIGTTEETPKVKELRARLLNKH
ncbi:uncharacterized protein LOC130217549 [Danio aesculapii]|uniref:uncharacterized protein LOC130217549 n=1 Tax=Danio aesculapii TaxID=1142201 RepID=UPI0024C037DE|nr:uncharacterized protein LOC130217549 [Danio aesculapii]